MDIQLVLLITRILLVMVKNLSIQVDAAKEGDGKVTAGELHSLIFQTALKTLDDLEAGEKLSSIITGMRKQ